MSGLSGRLGRLGRFSGVWKGGLGVCCQVERVGGFVVEEGEEVVADLA